MANFTLNGIQFEADNSSLKTAGKKTTKFGNYNNYDFDGVTKDNLQYFVNAVEIDWNGAQLGE